MKRPFIPTFIIKIALFHYMDHMGEGESPPMLTFHLKSTVSCGFLIEC